MTSDGPRKSSAAFLYQWLKDWPGESIGFPPGIFSSSTRLTRLIYLLRCVYTQPYSACVNIQEPQARWFFLSRWRPPGFKGPGYICQTCKSLLITKQRHKNKMAASVCKQFCTAASWYWWGGKTGDFFHRRFLILFQNFFFFLSTVSVWLCALAAVFFPGQCNHGAKL